MEIRKIKNYTVTCSDCGSELSFENSDMFSQPHEVFNRKGMTENIVSWWFIKCPICGKEIHVRYEKEFCDKVKFRYHDLGKSEKENKMTTTLDDINISIKNLASKMDTILDILLDNIKISEEKKSEIEAEKISSSIREMTEAVKKTENYQNWLEEIEKVNIKRQEYKENGIEGFQTPEYEEFSNILDDPTIYGDSDLFVEIGDPFHERKSKVYKATKEYIEHWGSSNTFNAPLISFIKKNVKEGARILLVEPPNLENYYCLAMAFPTCSVSLLTDNPDLKRNTKEKNSILVSKDLITEAQILFISDLNTHFADFDSLYDLVIRYKDF